MLSKSKSSVDIKKQLQKTASDTNIKSNKNLVIKKSVIDNKINQFKKSNTDLHKQEKPNEVTELVKRGYQILKDMNNIDEIKQGYHIKLKLKSTNKKKNDKITQGGFLVKVVKEFIDGKLEFYLQLKAYNKIYRYNIDSIAYIFYKEVTPNAIKIEKLEKKIEVLEKKHKLEYLKLIKLIKSSKI